MHWLVLIFVIRESMDYVLSSPLQRIFNELYNLKQDSYGYEVNSLKSISSPHWT
jgi:hypothetical protein